MSDKEKVLGWLNKQLMKKLIALERAEQKPNRSDAEIANIDADIDVLEYLVIEIGKKGGEADA